MQKTVGIIGGMGPLATVDLMTKIINLTPAQKDQDHVHIIVDNYPQIPDRTTAILNNGEDPTPYLIQSAQLLQKAGADLLMISCNTAHYFYDSIKNSVQIPILHMPFETAHYLQENKFKKVGLLATNGTIQTGLYQQNCHDLGIELIVPNAGMQALVMEGIYEEIKAGNLEAGFLSLTIVANELMKLGAEAVIAGCTEVPLVLKSTRDLPVIDPTEILAKVAVQQAQEPEKELQEV